MGSTVAIIYNSKNFYSIPKHGAHNVSEQRVIWGLPLLCVRCANFFLQDLYIDRTVLYPTVSINIQSDPTYPGVVVAGTMVYRAPSARSSINARSNAHAHYRPMNLASLLDLR